ncbi:Phytochrome-like protein cph2 [Arthrobacter sp. Bi83]|uniref:EAL domain-containing protein n=1 Tax=Arthrobacter sp. Bi83 TaxID=2822353 RepID=UPI001D45EE5F|nr:EAL domain-containing protein [Arthrobacter sp. Bi83]CAH0222189.1 Phytochrome-like protein cph2 [Arthrobacter sp. Bi83]
MSRDESFPAVTGAEQSPEPGGTDSPPQDVDRTTLRGQVLDLINDVLTDTVPEGAWARTQLRELLAANADEPERALLQHLIAVTTTDLTDSQADGDTPHEQVDGGQDPSVPEKPRLVPGPLDRWGRKRITAVLGTRMLLTAFQPIRELPAGHVAGFEALTRFVSRDGASADTWFREAAALGLGPDLEIAALHCALSAAREIPDHLFVAFNLSPASCRDPRILALLEGGDVALDRIVIEMVGQVSGQDLDGLIRVLGPLRQQGVRIAVDGSGPDTASPDQILQLVPDIIKLDRSFIEGIIHPNPAQTQGTDLVELAKQTGAVLSAKGIESQEELAAVTRAGMTAAQGYLLGRPSVHPLDWSAWIIEAATADAAAAEEG